MSSVKISLISTKPNALFQKVFSFLWAIVISMATATAVGLQATLQLPVTGGAIPNLFPIPQLIIGKKNLSEACKTRLTSAGFVSKSTTKEMSLLTGPSTFEAIQVAVREECITNVHATSNLASVDGIVALNIINRLLHFTLLAMFSATAITIDDQKAELSVKLNSLDYKYTEANLGTLPAKGFFFPYFEGLVLPDRAFPINWIISKFSKSLGTTTRIIASNTLTLSRGWASLADTPSGRMISHMIFVLDIAIASDCRVRPVYLRGEYSGMVVESVGVGVMTDLGVFAAGSKAELETGINNMLSHDAAVEAIANLLSSLTIREDKSVKTVSPADLISPRHIHDLVRIRELSPLHHNALVASIRKTKFRQTLWESSNPKQVQQAVAWILKGEFPPTDVPINIGTDALWSQDPIYSVLAAFAVKCPSIVGTGNSQILHISKEMYTKASKPGKLRGVPLFYKPLKEAYENWKQVMETRVVQFSSKGVDKEGFQRVQHVGRLMPFDDDSTKNIISSLCSMAAKKRKREDDVEPAEPTDAQKEEAQKAKKARMEAYDLFLGASTGKMDDLEF
jgi:hypothetical protein